MVLSGCLLVVIVVIWVSGLVVFVVVEWLMGMLLMVCCVGVWGLCDVNGVLFDCVFVIVFLCFVIVMGEDLVELYCYGGWVVVVVVEVVFGVMIGLCVVELGEFMWCVLLNGWIDLVEVEGLVDLFEVEIEM